MKKGDLDQAFEEFEKECCEGQVVRKEMIGMLRRQISKCEISEFDKALMITAKMSVLKTLDDLISNCENVSMKKLKMQLARKDSATNGAVGASIVELLKSIRANRDAIGDNGGAGVDRDAAMAQLKELQQSNKKLEVSAGETEACGSTPTTDGDAPVARPVSTQKEEDDEE